MTCEAGAGGELWLHRAEALGALSRGENVVVATATASGKSLVFQAWALHGIRTSPEPTALVLYPTKALANDQERHWLEAWELVGLPRETIGKINVAVGASPPGPHDQPGEGSDHDPRRLPRLDDPPGRQPGGPGLSG